MPDTVDLYDSTYGNFASDVLKEIRNETFGKDIGQNSWLTVDEYLRFVSFIELSSGSKVLEAACGSGGPAIFLAQHTGCNVTGIDINKNGIDAANRMAAGKGLADRINFIHADASENLPFENNSFDAIICIDAVNHLPGRQKILSNWNRILKPGGRILFTDPVIVTGQLTNYEISVRSSIGIFLFTPAGENEKMIRNAGFELLISEDVTMNEVLVSKRWLNSRAARKKELITIEGEERYQGLQEFLAMVHKLASERRLSRFVFAGINKSFENYK